MAIAKQLNKFIDLEKGKSNENDETRSVTIVVDKDGTVSAESFKLYNVRVSLKDVGKFALETSLSLLLTDDIKFQIVLSLLNIVDEFFPKLTITFNETDAKILLAIYQLNQQKVTIADVSDRYAETNTPSVSDDQIKRSLDLFDSKDVLRALANGVYEVREEMTYERK